MVKTIGVITLWIFGIAVFLITYIWVTSDYHENYRVVSSEIKGYKYNVTERGAKLSNINGLKLGDTLALFIKLNVEYYDKGLDDIGIALFLTPPPGADGSVEKITELNLRTNEIKGRKPFGLTWTDYPPRAHEPEYLVSVTKHMEEFIDHFNKNSSKIKGPISRGESFNYFVKADSLILEERNLVVDILLSDQ